MNFNLDKELSTLESRLETINTDVNNKREKSTNKKSVKFNIWYQQL